VKIYISYPFCLKELLLQYPSPTYIPYVHFEEQKY